MVEEMSALLDTQTAYFEARLAHLAPRERAIISAMALSRKNLTLQEIAGLTRLPLRSLSVQVDRLREQGYLSMTTGDGGKGTIYEVSDGLFRVWYQYRKGRKILQPLVQFLALWYPDEELENTLLSIRRTEIISHALLNKELIRLVEVQILEALSYSRSQEGRSERQQLWSIPIEPPKPASTKYSVEDLARFFLRILSFISPADAEVMFQEIFASLAPETAEMANLFLNVAHVLQAEWAVGSGRSNSITARRQEALAQVPPELRSTVDEIAQKVRAARKTPARSPKESAPAGPGGALPL
jgi:hypothetical protein